MTPSPDAYDAPPPVCVVDARAGAPEDCGDRVYGAPAYRTATRRDLVFVIQLATGALPRDHWRVRGAYVLLRRADAAGAPATGAQTAGVPSSS